MVSDAKIMIVRDPRRLLTGPPNLPGGFAGGKGCLEMSFNGSEVLRNQTFLARILAICKSERLIIQLDYLSRKKLKEFRRSLATVAREQPGFFMIDDPVSALECVMSTYHKLASYEYWMFAGFAKDGMEAVLRLDFFMQYGIEVATRHSHLFDFVMWCDHDEEGWYLMVMREEWYDPLVALAMESWKVDLQGK
jgi:hypothetical protein